MIETIPTSCPYCGEPVELCIDEEGGKHQAFVEDCPVCCQAWQVDVVQEIGGVWSALLRSSDE